MNFEPSQRAKDFQQRLMAFMDENVYGAEEVHAQESAEAGSRHAHPPVMEELKAEARRRGLWNLFLPGAEHGAGLTNLEYAPLAGDHGPNQDCRGGVQLQRAGHGQHGDLA